MSHTSNRVVKSVSHGTQLCNAPTAEHCRPLLTAVHLCKTPRHGLSNCVSNVRSKHPWRRGAGAERGNGAHHGRRSRITPHLGLQYRAVDRSPGYGSRDHHTQRRLVRAGLDHFSEVAKVVPQCPEMMKNHVEARMGTWLVKGPSMLSKVSKAREGAVGANYDIREVDGRAAITLGAHHRGYAHCNRSPVVDLFDVGQAADPGQVNVACIELPLALPYFV